MEHTISLWYFSAFLMHRTQHIFNTRLIIIYNPPVSFLVASAHNVCLYELGLLLFIADIEGLLAEFDVKHTEECITDCVIPRMFVFFAHFLNSFLRSMMSINSPEYILSPLSKSCLYIRINIKFKITLSHKEFHILLN